MQFRAAEEVAEDSLPFLNCSLKKKKKNSSGGKKVGGTLKRGHVSGARILSPPRRFLWHERDEDAVCAPGHSTSLLLTAREKMLSGFGAEPAGRIPVAVVFRRRGANAPASPAPHSHKSLGWSLVSSLKKKNTTRQQCRDPGWLHAQSRSIGTELRLGLVFEDRAPLSLGGLPM